MSSAAMAPTQAAPTQDERSMAMLAHVLMIFTGFIGPLIIWLIRKQSKYVSFHALQALWWQILWAGIVFILIVGGVLLTVLGAMAQQGHGGPPPIFVVLFPLAMLLAWAGALATLILGIVYGIKANNGEWAGYPLIGNWVRRRVGV